MEADREKKDGMGGKKDADGRGNGGMLLEGLKDGGKGWREVQEVGQTSPKINLHFLLQEYSSLLLRLL